VGIAVNDSEWDVVVIGAGVLGAFHAYFACRRGLRTLLLERHDGPRDASVRNFGMIAASAMPPGEWLRRGLESAAVYRELADRLPFPLSRGGMLYLATTPAEAEVLGEFARLGPGQGYRCRLLDAAAAVALNPAVNTEHCLAGLHFPDDVRLEPGPLFHALLPWMQQELGCEYRPATVAVGVTAAEGECRVVTSEGAEIRARHVFVCCGADLRTLFPARFRDGGLQRCVLQMMRTDVQPGVRLPTGISSGLTLRRYLSFRLCPSWVWMYAEPVDAELEERGIHVLLAQDADGRVVVGDSHRYGTGDLSDTLDARTEELILTEAARLVRLPHWRIAERWHGVYSLHPERDLYAETLHGRIHLLTGLFGKGMTVGPALAREAIDRLPVNS
jgi:FAD dependent oxidoreductase TIGR03364